MTREEYKKQHSGEGIAFMDNRECKPFRDLVGETITIKEWSHIKTKNGDGIVFICDEDNEHYYFANSIMADMLDNIDDIKAGDRFEIQAKPEGKKYYPVVLL